MSISSASAVNDQFVAGKNKIINGDFYVNQRNFTSSSTQSAYTYDRFRINTGSSTGVTYAANTFTTGTAPVAGYESVNFLSIAGTLTDSAGGWEQIDHCIEDVRTFAGQTVTLSFWAKGSASGTIAANLYQDFGTGGSSAVTITGQTVAITTSWARYSLTFSIPSISGTTIGTNNNLRVIISKLQGTTYQSVWGAATFTGTLSLWGIQLEAGTVATAFTTASGSIGGELALCQRYYYRWTATATYSRAPYVGASISTTSAHLGIIPPTPMRSGPSSMEYSANLRYSEYQATFTAISNFVLIGTTETGSGLGWQISANVASGLTAGRPGWLSSNNDANGYIGFSAEF
jgi:hypothetical protein